MVMGLNGTKRDKGSGKGGHVCLASAYRMVWEFEMGMCGQTLALV